VQPEFIEHRAIEVDAAQRVRVVRAEDAGLPLFG
jgi:hypothetical protein